MIWLHLPTEAGAPLPDAAGSQSGPVERRRDANSAELVNLAVHIAPSCAVVALSNYVTQEEGLLCLEAGASGYTSALSNPAVLRQIAMVVENGGLWVGPDLMARLRTALSRLQPQQLRMIEAKLAALSPREREVALAVSAGAANKEIARDMGITERTVKAHLTEIFERMGVRDRMQLALLINGKAAEN
ncbi:response regulator transcription factor [Parasulfuritortus cantonensis]|uniref:Response regulator transcription factor n=2 Tax=Parasulfuritortus cantonensis TaxID=2528202 RepID=A0A4R1BAH0_9PROT|nr:response regulator transcription factor [Parasulfuritortus cantonensis]